MKISTNIKLERVVEILTALFVFFLMLDPADILHLKMPLFALLIAGCAVSWRRVSWSMGLSFLMLCIMGVATLAGFVMGYDTRIGFAMGMYKTYVMLILLAWVPHIRLVERLRVPLLFMFLVVVALFVVTLLDRSIFLSVYYLLNSHPRFADMIMFGSRTFLGTKISYVYYTSAPVLLMLLGVVFQNFLRENRHRWRNFLWFFVALTPLVLGGTRAMLLSAFAIVGIMILLEMLRWGRLWRIASIGGWFFGTVAAMLVLSVFLGDKEEGSLRTKGVLSEAFFDLIDERPETLLWGNGPGATFDSHGIRGVATASELTYLELIRWYGVPLGVVVMAIYWLPLYLIYRKRKVLPYAGAVGVGFLFYLFLSGTNPYLLSSNGILALLAAYCYALNPYYEGRTI